MSLQTQIQSFVLRAAQEFNTVYAKIGSLASLSTTDKSSLVSAINELKSAVNASTSINPINGASFAGLNTTVFP